MYKILFAVLAVTALTGCQKETAKDAAYYVKHVDELKVLLDKCSEKIKATEKDGSEALKPLYDDKECITATKAKMAIKYGGMDKAAIKEPNGITYWAAELNYVSFQRKRWEGILKDLQHKRGDK